MTLKAFYEKTNADYDAVLNRLVNEKMVLKYLRKFLDDSHFSQLQQSIAAQDYETAYRSAHTLKGLCLTLGFTQMSVPVIALTEELRAGTTEHAQIHLAEITPLYTEIIQWISELTE